MIHKSITLLYFKLFLFVAIPPKKEIFMKKKLSGIFVSAVLSVFCLATYSYSAPLEIGALNFPPYYNVENDTTITGGYYVDMLKMVFERAGVEYTLKGYPAKRLYTNVGDGTTQVWMGTIGVAEYEGKTIVSPKQTSEINLEVYTLGSAEMLPKTLDDLKGKSVITIFGYNYGGTLKFLNDPQNNIKTEPAKTHESAFKMLQVGRAPFVLDYREPATETLAKINIPDIKKNSIKNLGIYIHISNKVPDAQAIMDKLMKAYDELKAEGKIK